MGSFSDTVSKFVKATPDRMLAAWRESVQRTIDYAQGPNMPVDTGFLRASIRGAPGVTAPPFTLDMVRDPQGTYYYDAQSVSLALARATLATGFVIIYLADYARAQEYGANGRPGRRFVGLAVQRWPQIVSEVSKDLEGRVVGKSN